MLELEDYYDLLDAIDGGFGIDLKASEKEAHLEAFRRMCCLLWVKNPIEEALFDQQFGVFLSEATLKDLEDKKAEAIKKSHDREKRKKEEAEDAYLNVKKSGDKDPLPDQPLEIPAPKLKGRQPVNPYQPAHHHFLLSERYYPLTRREMQQSWRHLHRPERVGYSNQLDVLATVRTFAKKGYLEKPLFQATYQNQINLTILVDVGGSMVAYDQLCKQLIRTAGEGGRVKLVSAYYFRNIPDDKIYLDPQRTSWKSLPEFIKELEPLRSSVLIISDAGAARRTQSLKRLYLTEGFLEEIRNKTLRMAWLNPFPAKRWKDSSAEEIAQWIHMFYLNRNGLDRAIDVLKGKTNE